LLTRTIVAICSAAVAIRLAQLDSDGPTGLVFEDDMQLMW
jgi:hypothetical protein